MHEKMEHEKKTLWLSGVVYDKGCLVRLIPQKFWTS